ncbi:MULTISPECIES: MurR/RpiR family transcriptional regulator [Geobacillus]|uniref:HTH-type transcriptional regulator GlvR n=1 Tax=Geobacillus icigianus TaxID=1430331 RepID=A0ABU6BD13_9BACL|nr:hypothetical protein [Geobacillus icigianus]MEB3749813.1 HTH-type transcriptional regulator GlvR [Geobacillus icigianus]
MRFDERVRLYADKLNDTDDQIVDYIIKHREEIADIPIQKMAEALYTVPNTIVRFAKKLGYKGFAELKAALALEQRDETAIKADGKTVIEKTKKLIDEQLIDEAKRSANRTHCRSKA